MSDFFNQVKNTILNSKEFYDKAQSIEKFCKKYQGKDFDDFSFTVTDRFVLDIKNNHIESKGSFDSSDLIYHSLMIKYLNKLTLRSNHQNRLSIIECFDLKFDGWFVLNTKFTIHYSNNSDDFKLLNKPLFPLSELWEKEMVLNFISPKNSFELYNSLNDADYPSRQGGIIGYVDDEKKALAIINKSNKFYVVLRYLNEQLNSELLPIIRNMEVSLKNDDKKSEIETRLFEILNKAISIDDSFFEIRSDKYMRTSKEKGQYLVNLWLDKNCPVEFRKIIGNFTKHQYWDYNPFEGDFAVSHLHLSENDFEHTPDFEFKFRKVE